MSTRVTGHRATRPAPNAHLEAEFTSMTGSGSVKHLAIFAALLAAYLVDGKLGLRLAFAYPSGTAVWPPTGLALAAFLILGYRVWPAIFVSAFLVNVTTAGSFATSLGIGAGNTLEVWSAPTWSTASPAAVTHLPEPRVCSGIRCSPPWSARA